ncbi:hypothetical protein [Poritiphilus flavus]|uniref:Uncharacterized protein n=1 Tax=Poritiphilus flavus TaxID=2697053 RepID=A0A6L9EEA9_9FLAO|nr:hypothetical protein [Poritiphilus flavus]NAS13080.1 hypothetical protein [Poritiphilus flavus]
MTSRAIPVNTFRESMFKSLKYNILTALTSIFVLSCASIYDHYTFTETLNTKVQVERLILNSKEPFADHRTEVDALKNQMQKMMLYEQSKNKNQITQKMWNYMNREDSAIQDFLRTWEAQGTMSEVFTEEFSPQITKAFDLMVDYESKKTKASENAILSFINNL